MRMSPDTSITIRRVEALEFPDEETFVVAMGEQPDGSGQGLIFQISLVPDEQDHALGMDTYCVCNEAGATIYGGVMSCILEGDLLRLSFTPEAAECLAVGEECHLQLQVDREAIERLREGLRRVLAADSAGLSRVIL